MQLTPFDRWLRETYVYETHIRTLRPPESIPLGIAKVELPDEPGKRYKHLYVAKSSKVADALIAQLKENGQMYTTQIVENDAWYVPFIAPKRKSVTWFLISLVMLTVSGFFTLLYVKGLTEDPEFRKNFMEAMKLLRS